jgi:L-2-hydroxyglutarate oxidase
LNTEFEAGRIVNCAGLYSIGCENDRQRTDVQILPFRGEYFNLKKEKEYLVKI